MFQKLHIRVHGFSLRPLDFPRICMSEYMDFSQALGFSGICISEYMDFPPALGFSKNLYVRVHGFFFPPQFYTSIFLGELNHLFSKTWPCKKNMYNFDFGKKINYTWIFKFLCIKTWFFGVGKIFWDFAFAPKNLSHPKKPSFYT